MPVIPLKGKYLLLIFLLSWSGAGAGEESPDTSRGSSATEPAPVTEAENLPEPENTEQEISAVPVSEEPEKPMEPEEIETAESFAPLPHSLNLSGAFTSPVDEKSADPLAFFGLSWSRLMNPVLSLGVSQSATKFFYVDEKQQEITLKDTVFSLFISPPGLPLGAAHSFNLAMTLPLSKESLDNGRLSTLSGSDNLSWSGLWFPELSMATGLQGMYYINRYQTAHENYGGGPLPQFMLQGSLLTSWKFTGQASLSFSASYGEIRYEKNAPASSRLLKAPVDHPYSFSLGGGYRLGDYTLSLTGSQSNILEVYGSRHLYLYDASLTWITLSLGRSLRF